MPWRLNHAALDRYVVIELAILEPVTFRRRRITSRWSGGGYHSYGAAEHLIVVDSRFSVESTLRVLRHEMEHAKQTENDPDYWQKYTEAADRAAPQYHLNPYEVAANAAADNEWRDLLPCIRHPRRKS